MPKFDQENCELEYYDIDWLNILKLGEKSVNLATNNFRDAMNYVMNKCASLKKLISINLD